MEFVNSLKHNRRRRRRQNCFKFALNNHLKFVLQITTLIAITQLTAKCLADILVTGHDLDQFHLPESMRVNSLVHTLKAFDKSNPNRRYSYHLASDVFTVDESNGEVRLAKPIDRERQANMTVVVSVSDADDGKGEILYSRKRFITIDDIDDSWPNFLPHKFSSQNSVLGHHSYQVDINERVPLNTTVIGEILASDADEGINSEILFECRDRRSTNSACDVFFVESRRLGQGKYSATIKTKKPLDFEKVQSYRLALVARGRRPSPLKGEPLETEAFVDINVINLQDEGPVFANAPFSLSLEEGLKNGTRLMNLIVQDGDAAPQRELSVIVVPSPYSQFFRLEKDEELQKVWYLTSNQTIDGENPLISEAGNVFTISLLAAELDDSGVPIANEDELLSAIHESNYQKGTLRKENITVLVLDLPDSRPIFMQSSTAKTFKDNLLVLNISESLTSGSSIPNLDLTVMDLDQGANSRFNLTLIDSETGPSASQAFVLESATIYGRSEVVLNVLNSTLIDFEDPNHRTYKFMVVASKNTQPPLAQMLEIQININDANDNAPEFDQDQYIVEVLEGSPPGTLVTTIKALDKDSGVFGKVDYSLRGAGASKFRLISNEAKIVVGDCGVSQCLDFETQPTFSLTYEARDGAGKSTNVSVIINLVDINDHPPKFSESVYKRELISDNLSNKQSYISPQLVVRAKDLDGPTQGRNNITYRIKSTNLTNLDIDRDSGFVYINQPFDLNSAISNQLANISDQPSHRQLTNKKVVFEAEIVAEDNGTPMLSSSAKILLVVKGNRDGAPQFRQEQYPVAVRESQPVNKPFLQVQAIDPDEKDSQLRYSSGYDLNDLININVQTGELSFKRKIDFEEFKGVPYNISVIATDNNKPYPLQASALVSISVLDVNDKPPKFIEKEYKATIVQGSTKPGDVVLQVTAIDPDTTALLNYSIVSDLLSVTDRNGQSFSLDDIMNSTSGYISQMSNANRQHLADDLKNLFQMEKTSGIISLKHEPDYSFASSLTFFIKAIDLNQEIPRTAAADNQQDLVVCTFYFQTHSDRSPIFAPPWTMDKREYNITIQEEIPIGATIFSLLAKDPMTNNRIDFFEKLIESDPRDYFRVDKSGAIVVNKRIDYEELPNPKRLSVSVKALADDVYFSVANLNIHVADINDNAPQFKKQNYTVSVSESVSYPQELIVVSAQDKDSSEFGQVSYSLTGYSSDLFSIHPKKGYITLKKGVKLDRDLEPSHTLMVSASDCNETHQNDGYNTHNSSRAESPSFSCRRSSVVVTINLLDENDNSPVFVGLNKKGEYEALISETFSIGSVLAQVRATDLDEGSNGQVAYEIIRGNDPASKLIKVDSDGFVSAAGSLSGLGRSSPYKVTIRAYDQGKVSRESLVTLSITISDVVSNDGVPKFLRPAANEVVSISESTGPSTFVYQVQAVDPDEDSNGKLMYKFIQPSDTFEIDPFTGIIKTQYRPNFYLDREQVPNYTLIIVAQDLGSPPKQAHQVLTIRITDVNDNEPQFERRFDDPPIVLQVEEEVPKNTLIGIIRAVDKDAGQDALIGYDIIEGNHNNLFSLDYEPDDNSTEITGNNACRIYSTGRLDRETRESYTLTIKAHSMSKLKNQFIHQLRDPLGDRNPFNHYNASDLSKIRVTIRLLDINDNRPVFSVDKPKSVVDSSAEVYSQLMVFRATDADVSSSDIQYSIVDVLYHSDSKLNYINDESLFSNQAKYQHSSSAVSMRHVFDLDSRSGILRNSMSLRPFIDGYFEVFVKADSGSYSQMTNPEGEVDPSSYSQSSASRGPDLVSDGRCLNTSDASSRYQVVKNATDSQIPFAEVENCYTTVSKAMIFITHQRETFRFVFNKTKLNDRLDEFKTKMQRSLEEFMFEPQQSSLRYQASLEQPSTSPQIESSPRAERVYLKTFNTDFYERGDGSLDFSTVTSCSQLIKFDDSSAPSDDSAGSALNRGGQVVNYEEVVSLLKTLNSTNMRSDKAASLFGQYGLVNVERCLSDKTKYKMSLSERLSLYLAAIIAIVGSLLAFIVSRMRKSYEKNLKLLQRSKYQYMGQYATLAPGFQTRPTHHMSLGTIPANNFLAPAYGSQMDAYDVGAGYDTWQL